MILEQTLQSEALRLINLGFKVIPHIDKKPYIKNWAKITPTKCLKLNFAGCDGVGIVCGETNSNFIEVIDIDLKVNNQDVNSFLQAFKQALKTANISHIYKELVIVKTKNNGLHIPFYSGVKHRSQKLGFWDNSDNKDRYLIETRGDGGFIVIPPTNNYTYLQGNYTKLPKFSAEIRSILIEICSCSSYGLVRTNTCKNKHTANTQKAQNSVKKTNIIVDEECDLEAEQLSDDNRIGTIFSQKTKLENWFFSEFGGDYSEHSINSQRVYFQRVGSSGNSPHGYIDRQKNVLYYFSTKGNLEPTKHTAFSILAAKKFNNDFRATAASLIKNISLPNEIKKYKLSKLQRDLLTFINIFCKFYEKPFFGTSKFLSTKTKSKENTINKALQMLDNLGLIKRNTEKRMQIVDNKKIYTSRREITVCF